MESDEDVPAWKLAQMNGDELGIIIHDKRTHDTTSMLLCSANVSTPRGPDCKVSPPHQKPRHAQKPEPLSRKSPSSPPQNDEAPRRSSLRRGNPPVSCELSCCCSFVECPEGRDGSTGFLDFEY